MGLLRALDVVSMTDDSAKNPGMWKSTLPASSRPEAGSEIHIVTVQNGILESIIQLINQMQSVSRPGEKHVHFNIISYLYDAGS